MNYDPYCCRYGYGKDSTYTYIEDARRNLDQASKSLASSTHNTTNTVSRKTGETLEGAEQIIGDNARAVTDKAAGAWDATKQKADELTDTALKKKEEAKDSVGQTWDATKQEAGELAGVAEDKKEETKDRAECTWRRN